MRIIGAIAVVVFSVIPTVIPNPISWIFPVLAGSLFLFLDPLMEYFEQRKSDKEKHAFIKKCIDDLNIFLAKYLSLSPEDNLTERIIEQIKANEIELRKEKIFNFVIKNYINIPYSDNDLHIMFTLSICFEIDNSDDKVYISELRNIADRALTDFDIKSMDEETKKLLLSYNKYKTGSNDILNGKEIKIDYRQSLMEFAHKYCSIYTFATQIFFDNDKAYEVLNTLRYLLKRGKLSSPLLNQKAIEDINKSLLRKSKQSRGFILLINNYQKLEEVDISLSKFPQIKFGHLYPSHFPEGVKYLHMRIIYPENQFISPKQFLKREIIDKVPEEEIPKGFAAVIPIEATEIFSFPKVSGITSEYVKQALSNVNYLKTGVSKDMNEIIIEYFKSESKIIEVLSIIPFNVFVPDMESNGKVFLIDNYNTIKKHFKVESLFDWADVKHEELSDKLIELDEGKTLSKKRWKEICKSIITEAKKHSVAIDG